MIIVNIKLIVNIINKINIKKKFYLILILQYKNMILLSNFVKFKISF